MVTYHLVGFASDADVAVVTIEYTVPNFIVNLPQHDRWTTATNYPNNGYSCTVEANGQSGYEGATCTQITFKDSNNCFVQATTRGSTMWMFPVGTMSQVGVHEALPDRRKGTLTITGTGTYA